MRLSPFHSVLWYCFLSSSASCYEMEDSIPQDWCDDVDIMDGEILYQSSTDVNVEEDEMGDNFTCLFYPANVLKCSWSFLTLQNETQFKAIISICDHNRTVKRLFSTERVESKSLALPEYNDSRAILQFNMSLHDKWTLYTSVHSLEVPSPPKTITAEIQNGVLNVTWSLPFTRQTYCFEYEVDIGNQEKPKIVKEREYTEDNVDPNYTYRVRIRTKIDHYCLLNTRDAVWSEWSHVVTLEQSLYTHSVSMIILILLGIPPIFLAMLLLWRYQRLSEVLYPTIPRPPLKYMYFLERNDSPNFFSFAPAAEPTVEITEVEDVEPIPEKTF